MFMVVIVIFKDIDASLSIKCKPGLIPQIFESSVDSMKASIISFSPIFFVAVVIMELQSGTYVMYVYLFLLLDVVGKLPHISE